MRAMPLETSKFTPGSLVSAAVVAPLRSVLLELRRRSNGKGAARLGDLPDELPISRVPALAQYRGEAEGMELLEGRFVQHSSVSLFQWK